MHLEQSVVTSPPGRPPRRTPRAPGPSRWLEPADGVHAFRSVSARVRPPAVRRLGQRRVGRRRDVGGVDGGKFDVGMRHSDRPGAPGPTPPATGRSTRAASDTGPSSPSRCPATAARRTGCQRRRGQVRTGAHGDGRHEHHMLRIRPLPVVAPTSENPSSYAGPPPTLTAWATRRVRTSACRAGLRTSSRTTENGRTGSALVARSR